jgi:predicted ATPase
VYETLRYLVENAGRLIDKKELLDAVWPDSFVTDDSLVQCTLELRRALEDREQQLLRTVPRRGYVFAAEVLGRVANPESRVLARPDFRRRQRDLPAPRTSLVGREQEVAEAAGLLVRPEVRLLTITGPGGAGKTRLAIAVASATAERFTAGVQFVGLASITDPDFVGTTLAEALEIHQVANRTLPQLIGEQLQNSGPFLLVIDNFEQVLPAATVIAGVLEACPSLKILVTSRSCLRIYGEQEFPVKALPQLSATELFAQRAAAVRPGFALNSENIPLIREICLRLDGLPLAIELAAARTKVLSPRAILERLESRLQLLTGGALDLPERQQTLRNTIDWSHGLLNDAERKLFRRLSVFSGGCTLEGAEAVCNTKNDLGADLFDGLSSLVDKNLIQHVDASGGVPRYAMLETIRDYALESLSASGEEFDVRRAHAAFCLVLAEEGNPELGITDRVRWLTECDAEIGNFRFALDWLFQAPDPEWAMRLCGALFRFWDIREHLSEGRARLETVLRLAGDGRTRERARIAQFIGALATTQGDYPAARDFLERGLSLYEELGDESGIAASLNALGVTARDRGDYSTAQSCLERSLACWRLLSDRMAIARCLHNLANVVRLRGDYSRARWALREAAEVFEELGDRTGAAWSINQQGDVARAMGDMTGACNLYQRALATFREAGDLWGAGRSLTDLAYIVCAQGDHSAGDAACREALRIFAGLGHRRGIARALESSACLAVAQGHAERALKLAGAAGRLRESIGAPLHQEDRIDLDQMLVPAWAQLGEAESQRAWDEGSSMSEENALAYALSAAAPA